MDGEYGDWLEVLRLIYHSGAYCRTRILHKQTISRKSHFFNDCTNPDIFVGPSPAELSRETAFRIFPIVHQYGMQLMVGWCEKALVRSQMDLWPSDPIASSEVLNHPGLVQCLALADAKQCDSLVQSCLSRLIKPGSVTQNIHSALASPHLGKLMDGLRSDTNRMIIRKLVGLPADYKVR